MKKKVMAYKYKHGLKSNQIFHYTRWITPKRVTSWRIPSPHHCGDGLRQLVGRLNRPEI